MHSLIRSYSLPSATDIYFIHIERKNLIMAGLREKLITIAECNEAEAEKKISKIKSQFLLMMKIKHYNKSGIC